MLTMLSIAIVTRFLETFPMIKASVTTDLACLMILHVLPVLSVLAAVVDRRVRK